MSMSDDQERCSICKYHGCCPVDANGYTPCEKDYAKDEEDDYGQEE